MTARKTWTVGQAVVEALKAQGVRVVFGLPSAARDEILPLLDRCAELKNKVG